MERDNLGNAGLGAQPGKGDLDDMLSTIKKQTQERKEEWRMTRMLGSRVNVKPKDKGSLNLDEIEEEEHWVITLGNILNYLITY